jgi:hypothetical protein
VRILLAFLWFFVAYVIVWVDGGPEWASAGFAYIAWLVAYTWKDEQ